MAQEVHMPYSQKIPDECEDDFWWRLVIAARGSTLHQFFNDT